MRTLSPRSFATTPLPLVDGDARSFLRAMRIWVMMARCGRNPRPALCQLLGDSTARFCLLADSLVTAWPDPFITYPPCATSLTPDEDGLLKLLADAAAGDRAAADARLSDLLPANERDRLWAAATRLMADRMGV
jgi:hypothetical protein